jgi:hypothetical protein
MFKLQNYTSDGLRAHARRRTREIAALKTELGLSSRSTNHQDRWQAICNDVKLGLVRR